MSLFVSISSLQLTLNKGKVNTDQRQKKEHFRMTFSINGAPICDKALKQIEITKTHRSLNTLKGKASKGLKKRQVRSIKRRATKVVAIVTEFLPKAKKVSRVIPNKVTRLLLPRLQR
ncbi:hypothetical protein PanWU01x14_057050 [Parasponia andersonii]|uniref:Ribosomal protein n=1 Tax=Parasponia andersonii TaxID=3476 RepID=A0A2P5DJR6_PARAD|nr:hypothetical protein PanWU01x14_057050 [Parasponia andersonii]